MKKAFAIGALLSGIRCRAAQASEFGLLLDKEIGRAKPSRTGSGLQNGSYDKSSPTGVGFRAAYTFLDLKVAEFGAAVTYHPKSRTISNPTGTTIGKLGNQYVAIGVQADWKFLLNLHAGLDMRSEKLTTTTSSGTDSTTLTRPWVKAGVGFALPTPAVSPFVRLEVAVPLTTPIRPPVPPTTSARPWPRRSRWPSTAASGSDHRNDSRGRMELRVLGCSGGEAEGLSGSRGCW